MLVLIYTGRTPTKRTFELLCYYMVGWAHLDESAGPIDQLNRKSLERLVNFSIAISRGPFVAAHVSRRSPNSPAESPLSATQLFDAPFRVPTSELESAKADSKNLPIQWCAEQYWLWPRFL